MGSNESQKSVRSALGDVYRLGGLKLVGAAVVASVGGLLTVAAGRLWPGFGDRAMQAVDRFIERRGRNPH